MGGSADGRAWIAALPDLRDEAATAWHLTVGQHFRGSNVSYVAPAVRADGVPVVLEINYPEAETREEPEALDHWAGQGAVRLIDRARRICALLLERLDPGDSLLDQPEPVSLEVGAAILAQLHRRPPDAHAFRSLDSLAAGWADLLRSYPDTRTCTPATSS